MIPARDEQEFSLLPKPDVAFVQTWLQFTDIHLGALRNQAPIPNLQEASIGTIDGTHAMYDDDSSGFVFLFNPSIVPLNLSLTADESVGLSNNSIGTATLPGIL